MTEQKTGLQIAHNLGVNKKTEMRANEQATLGEKFRDLAGSSETNKNQQPIISRLEKEETRRFAEKFRELYQRVLLFDDSKDQAGVSFYDKDKIYLTEQAEKPVKSFLAQRGISYSERRHGKFGGFEYFITQNGEELDQVFKDLKSVYEYIYEEILGAELATTRFKRLSQGMRRVLNREN